MTKALKVAVVNDYSCCGSEGSGNTVITKLDGLQKLSLRVPEVFASGILYYESGTYLPLCRPFRQPAV